MQETVDLAIRAVTPGAVIAVGVAFGVNERKQKIGDILLSRRLRLYELARIGKVILLRDDSPHASQRLINHFETFSHVAWKGAPANAGILLTGNKVVDRIDYRDQLLEHEPEAMGGEMEGAGLYVASHNHKVDWIVIKAICDWADGLKHVDKTQRQTIAANNAARFVVEGLRYATLSYQELH